MRDNEPENQFRRQAVVRFLNWRAERKRRKPTKVRRVIERQDDAAQKAMDAAGFVEGGWDELNL